VNPNSILVHTCSHYHDLLADCSHLCDYNNSARRPFPAAPLLAQISSFEHSVEFLPVLSDITHLSSLHSSMPAYWSAPELCGAITRPKSKLRKRQLKESGGKVDIWSIGILALTLIERNLMLSPVFPRTKDSLSTTQLRDLTVKQMARLKTSPKILQARRWTTLAQDFVHSCLRIDYTTRPTASALLKHPFMTNSNETCLMTQSDVSESETSPLDETYEDSTYIPAPESDSFGGSSDDWSDVEDDVLPHSGRSHYTPSAPSLGKSGDGGGGISSEDSDYKHTGSNSEEDIEISSLDTSTGSVVIIDSDSELSSRTAPPSKLRKRGKSDGGNSDQQVTPSPEKGENPLMASASIPSGPHTPPQRARHNNIRRKTSSEYLEAPGGSTTAGATPSGHAFGGDDESPPSSSHSMITVHTHRMPNTLKSSHEGEKASRRFGSANTTSSASTNTPAAQSASGSPGSGSRGPSSAPTATVFAVRDRTPSPAKHALPNFHSPGRRSSLPMLPMLDAIGSHPGVTVHPAPTYQASPPVSPLHSTSSSGSHSWGSGGLGHAATTGGSLHLAQLPVPSYSSTKASTLSEPFKPVHLSKSMRSRSEDTLIDKETAMAIHSARGTNPTIYNLATGTAVHTARGEKDSASASNLGVSSSMQRSPSGQSMTSSPSSSNLPSSPNSASPSSTKSKKKSKKHKAESPLVPAAGLLISTDESVRKEIEEIELKWLGEIRRRAKALEQKEKDIVDKAAARLRTVHKHYDSQIALISKRAEQRTTELKNRMAAERTKLMSERAKEIDRESTPINRRNSFSGGFTMSTSSELSSFSSLASSGSSQVVPTSPTGSSSSATSSSILSPPSSGRRTSFPRRVLHLNYEKSVHDMDRRHLIERQEIELKSMEDSAAVEREYAVQKYLVEQTQLELTQEARRQCIDDTFALKWKMNEEIKACTRKNISRRVKKLISSDGALKTLSDDPASVEVAIWQILLAPMPSARATTDAAPGAALSSMEITPEYILTPAELTGGVQERYQKSVELQKWRQEEELALLSLDVQHAEQHRADATAMNQRHALELAELQSGFEAHYVHTRQEFLSERLNRLMYYENELVELKYRYARRMIVKTKESEVTKAYETIEALQKADLDTIASIHAAKRQELTALVASVYPVKPISASSSSAQLLNTDDSYDY
jgi:hypothetical protein